MNRAVLQPSVQQFILDNLNEDIQSLILKGARFEHVSIQEIAAQIIGRNMLAKKAPDYLTKQFYFPPKINLEQSSSQATALYKEKLISDCKSIIDLTGGTGVDLFFLSKSINNSLYCEINPDLYAITKHNFSLHKRNTAFHLGDGIEFLKESSQRFDCIFVDPSRRNEAKGKIINLIDSQPDIIKNWELLLSKSKRIIVKLSPILDIEYLKSTLTNITEIHVLAIKQDVKELIVVAENEYSGQPKVIAASMHDNQVKAYSSTSEGSVKLTQDISDYKYIYEPFSVLLKAKLNDDYAVDYTLVKADVNTHLYFNDAHQTTSLFKRFEIIDFPSLDRKQILSITKSPQLNVVSRNYPLKPEQVIKKLKFSQGGYFTLFCFRQGNKNKYVLAKRIL